MYLRALITILIIFFTSKCISQKLFPTKAINKVFDKNQVGDLNKVLDFVDSIVLSQNYDVTKVSDAYHIHLDSLFRRISTKGYGSIAIEENKKYTFLKSLDSNSFKEIWKFGDVRMIRTADTIIENPVNYTHLDINNQGLFMNYLKQIKRINPLFKFVYKKIEASGDLSPTLVSAMFQNHNDFNFENTDERLWVAIFLITLEESIESKVDRYYKN